MTDSQKAANELAAKLSRATEGDVFIYAPDGSRVYQEVEDEPGMVRTNPEFMDCIRAIIDRWMC